MSIGKYHDPDLRKALMKAVIEADALPIVDAVNLILAIKGTSIPGFAKDIGVSRQMVYGVLVGSRKSKKVKEALSGILGFEP